MEDSDDFVISRLRPRACEDVTISIPTDVMEKLRHVAEERDMSPGALLRFYIGQGLREDLSRRWMEQNPDTPATQRCEQ